MKALLPVKQQVRSTANRSDVLRATHNLTVRTGVFQFLLSGVHFLLSVIRLPKAVVSTIEERVWFENVPYTSASTKLQQLGSCIATVVL